MNHGNANNPAIHDALSSRDAPARQREISHTDMDAFYASVEQRDNPALCTNSGNPILDNRRDHPGTKKPGWGI